MASNRVFTAVGKPIKAAVPILQVGDTVAVLDFPKSAKGCLISVEKDPTATTEIIMRWRDNTENPTSSIGHALRDGDLFDLEQEAMSGFKIIGLETGKIHTLQISYYE